MSESGTDVTGGCCRSCSPGGASVDCELALALGPVAHGWLGRIGLVFLVLAGIGELMAAFFDIDHRLHEARRDNGDAGERCRWPPG